MSTKITKKGASTIKTLILLLVGTIVAAQVLPRPALVLAYPALMLGLIFLLPVFHRFRKTQDFNFFGNLCFAAIFTIAYVLAAPYVDKLGLMIGFAAVAFVYIMIAMIGERVMGSDIDATLMTVFFLVLSNFALGLEQPARSAAAFLAAAVILDLSKKGFPMWIRGLFAGLAWSAIIFGFGSADWVEISTPVVYSAAAGLVAGSLFGLLHLDDQKHIEKMLKKI